MQTFKILAGTLFLCLCFQLQLEAQTSTYTFKNENPTYDAILEVNGTPRGTIKKLQKATVPSLNIGDVVTVSVKDKPDLTWYPIYITEQTPKVNPIVINPKLALGNTDSRELGISPLNYYYNTKGMHIRDYDPQNVAGSFKKFDIFEGISNECIDWNQSQNGQYIITEGFHYDRVTKAAETNESTLTQNRDDYKKTFHVNLETAFPIPKAPPGTKGSIDFGYEKTNQQTLSNTSYNWSASKKVFSYEMSVKDLGRLRMDQDFLDYIEAMAKNRYTVEEFVEKYGTHYPEQILYGGQFVKYISMEKDDYYEAEREDWNVGLGVSKSEDGTKTRTETPGGYTESGSSGSSQVMDIKLDFGETTETAARNLLKKSKAQAFYLGGSGFGEDWEVKADNATAVKVKTNRISELFYPHILKNDWTVDKCKTWRDAIRAEVYRQETLMPRLAASSRIKTRRFKVRTVKLHKTYEVDDTDKRIKGHVWLVSKTPSVKAVEQTFRDGVPIKTIWWENNFTDVFAKGPLASMQQSKFGKWQVFEQTSDANGNFAPIKFECNGNIYEAGIFGGQDRLDFTSGQQIDLSDLSGSSAVPHKMKLENNKTIAERYHVEITIEFKPSFDFADMFGNLSANRSITSGAPKMKLPNPKVEKAPLIQIASSSVDNSTETTLLSTTPAKEVKWHSQNSMTLAQAQAMAKNNGWTMASAAQVQDAWTNQNLDVYAFGMMADGRFAVPVQSDHSNFKKGANIGATGGNQGFFYTIPEAGKMEPAKTPSPTVSETMAPYYPGFVRIQNNWYKKNYIHNQNGKIEQGEIQPGWESAHWKIVPAHSGWVRIQNKWKPDQYLHNQNGKLEVGPIQPNWASAMWKLVPAHSGWVRVQNSWKPDHYIHNQNGEMEAGPIQPNWASALWKVE